MKITFLGDSIRQQYAPVVNEALGDKFEIWYPEDNCRFAKYTLRGLFEWQYLMEGTDIVHWNNGHWDVCDLLGDGSFSTEEEYIANMLRVLYVLQKRYKIIIFATTTPVKKENQFENNKAIERFNDIIVPILEERGVIINDLYGLLKGNEEKYICDDTIHLSKEGIDACAKQVTNYIIDAVNSINNKPDTSDKLPKNDTDYANTGAPVLI